MLTAAVAFSGCNVPSPAASVGEPGLAMDCMPPPHVLVLNLTVLTYRVTFFGGMGGSSAYDLPARDVENLKSLDVRAEWPSNPVYLHDILFTVVVFYNGPAATIQGPSPLIGHFDFPVGKARYEHPYIALEAPRSDPAGAKVALVDQPITITLQEHYC
jgi:hypothetical protein